MTEPEPSRLDKLSAVRTYLQWQLGKIEQSIRDEEARLAHEQPATSWRLQHLPGGPGQHGRGMLHRDGCPFAEGAEVGRGEAVAALGEESVAACEVCRPEAGLRG